MAASPVAPKSRTEGPGTGGLGRPRAAETAPGDGERDRRITRGVSPCLALTRWDGLSSINPGIDRAAEWKRRSARDVVLNPPRASDSRFLSRRQRLECGMGSRGASFEMTATWYTINSGKPRLLSREARGRFIHRSRVAAILPLGFGASYRAAARPGLGDGFRAARE